MFSADNIVVGLEAGTAKICVIVGEVLDNDNVNIIGIGQARSRAVRKGEVVDAATLGEDLRNAIVEAEQMADVEVRSVFLGVTGNHIQCINNRGLHTVLSPDRVVTREDVQDVVKNAKAINLPPGGHVVHAVRQHYTVDNQRDIENPEGMAGGRLEVDMHVIHGQITRLENPIRAVRGLQLIVDALVFNGLASTLALLSHEQKQLGALVIDLGAGATEYVVCANGIVKHSGVLAVGGDHVTNDLAVGLKLPLHLAEELKKRKGRAMMDEAMAGQNISLTSELGLPEKLVNLEHLGLIMTARLEEIFELILEDVAQAGVLEDITAGVFLCGGGVRIPDIVPLARHFFQLPVCVGRVNGVSGIPSSLDQPEFATAIGLARYGALQWKQQRCQKSFGQGLRSRLSQIFKRA